jgi:hypothetical protein
MTRKRKETLLAALNKACHPETTTIEALASLKAYRERAQGQLPSQIWGERKPAPPIVSGSAAEETIFERAERQNRSFEETMEEFQRQKDSQWQAWGEMNADYDQLEKDYEAVKAKAQRATELLRGVYQTKTIFNYARGEGPLPWHEAGKFLAEFYPEIGRRWASLSPTNNLSWPSLPTCARPVPQRGGAGCQAVPGAIDGERHAIALTLRNRGTAPTCRLTEHPQRLSYGGEEPRPRKDAIGVARGVCSIYPQSRQRALPPAMRLVAAV